MGALDSMQAALETEAKGKAEALRMKKKLEADAADLSLALEHAIAGNAETQNTIKKYQQQVRDAQVKVDEESAAKSAAADAKLQLIARLQLCKMPLRKAVLCWKLQIARDVQPNKNLLTPMRH